MIQRLVLSFCLLLAACQRPEPANGDTPQVAAAKAAVVHKMDTPERAEFRNILEYKDGVVCGEVDAKKMYSGTQIGFRKFIYNAPEPGALVIDSGTLSREEVAYWCSEQPDKRLRMLAASYAELKQACEAAGNKGSEMSCRLAATQKQSLDELVAASGRAAPATVATAAASQASPPASAVAVAAAPAVAPSVAPVARPPAAPAAGNVAALPAEVEAALKTWRERWEAGDVDGYLRLYEASFTGGAGSHAQWEQQRRQKMKDVRPSVGVEGLQVVRVTPQEVELRFLQVYSAKQHRDKGNKTMVFRRSAQGWLIADERWAKVS